MKSHWSGIYLVSKKLLKETDVLYQITYSIFPYFFPMQIIENVFLHGGRDMLLPLELQKGCVFCMKSVEEVRFFIGT